MARIPISQSWSGSGKHGAYTNYVYNTSSPSLSDDTAVSYSQNKSTRTSTVTLTNNIAYYQTNLSLWADPCRLRNQTYTVKLGNVTRSGSIGDKDISDKFFPTTRIAIPNLTYSVSHIAAVSVPYSLTYKATVQCDQNDDIYGQTNYRTFTVTVTYSGSITVPRYNSLYGSVSGKARPIHTMYCSVNGKSRRITKLYGSVNGKSKRIL